MTAVALDDAPPAPAKDAQLTANAPPFGFAT